jgi:hypothetical protein
LTIATTIAEHLCFVVLASLLDGIRKKRYGVAAMENDGREAKYAFVQARRRTVSNHRI